MKRMTRGDLILEIADDASFAQLTIRNGNHLIDESDLLELLQESGIQEGWDEAGEAMRDEKLEKQFDTPFPVAVGIPVVEPRVEFSLRFDPEHCIDPSNHDFSALTGREIARPGQPLADLFITKSGRPGINVYGEEVPPSISDEVMINAHLGENVHYSQEQSKVLASSAGYPFLDSEGRVHLKNEFVIDGDLGAEGEHLQIFANLTVNGGIKNKIELAVGGNLTVNGDIDDASVVVEGSLKVNGDILNCRNSGLTVMGDIEFNNAENARIACAQRIQFSENAHFCRMVAERGVYGDAERSSIIGGIVQSGENVEVAVIGNSSSIGTEIEITIRPFLKEKMLSAIKRLTALRENPGENEEEIASINDEIQLMEHQLEEEINRALMSGDSIPRHIAVYRRMFAGTYLRILKKSRTIVEELQKVSFAIVNGEMVQDNYNV